MATWRFTGGRIRRFAAGSDTELLVHAGRVVSRPEGQVTNVDLQGGCLMPGFVDSHVHFPTWAMAQGQVRLEGCASVDEALERVAKAAQTLPDGRWLRGLGWRADEWEPHTEPTRQMLDAAAPGIKIALMARDYHSLWLSTAALDAADWDVETPGGVVERDAEGIPTGVVRELSAWAFRDNHASPTRTEYLEAMRNALPIATARGVTCIHDKDGWLGAADLFQALDDLPLRVWQSTPHDRLETQPGDYVKAFMDGTMGSRTAHLMDGSGVVITSRDEFEDIVRRATARNLPVAVHAIGDRANRDALDAFEAVKPEWAPRGLRQRIEHTQLLTKEDIPRFKQIGVAASVQLCHAVEDAQLAAEAWAGMTDRAYAYRSLIDAGARVVNGSDAPVSELDPLYGVRAGVNRTFHPEQRLTIDQAFRATTTEPAWLTKTEDRLGTLADGMEADLVWLDRDPYDDLENAEVIATMCKGEWTAGSFM